MSSLLAVLFAFVALASGSIASSAPRNPHVVFFIIDDVGHADVSFNPGSGMHTPVLDEFMHTGIALKSMHAQPVCSPTRTAILQGRYPFRKGQGLQHYSTIKPGSTAHMPVGQPTIAELLRSEANYSTHAIGKWHCGYSKFDHTPTGRGFDTHMGYFQGQVDYFNKTFHIPNRFVPIINITGLDWWHNRTSVSDERGIHNKYLYDREMHRVLDSFDANGNKPMFMYYAHQVAHYPIEPPKDPRFFQHCQQKDDVRRKYCAMMAALDDSLDLLIKGLKNKGMWNDTLLVIMSDNGGLVPVPGEYPASAGSNYPLRAGKGTVFQGGVRVVAGINGGDNVIPATRRGSSVSNQLLHAVDLLPTVLGLTDAQSKVPQNVDGVNAWNVLMGVSNADVRDALPLDINKEIEYPDSGWRRAVVTKDGWKLIEQAVQGETLNYDGWYLPNGTDIPPPHNPTPGKFLFNINNDPFERTNLFQQQPEIVQKLRSLLDDFEKDYQNPQSNFVYPSSFPYFHDGVWHPFSPIL